jgi:hypothetical protein
MRLQILGKVFALAIALPFLPAHGQTAAPAAASPALQEARAKMRAACTADVAKFCANVVPGKGAIVRCLRSHADEVSPDCRSAREEVRAIRRKEKG